MRDSKNAFRGLVPLYYNNMKRCYTTRCNIFLVSSASLSLLKKSRFRGYTSLEVAAVRPRLPRAGSVLGSTSCFSFFFGTYIRRSRNGSPSGSNKVTPTPAGSLTSAGHADYLVSDLSHDE